MLVIALIMKPSGITCANDLGRLEGSINSLHDNQHRYPSDFGFREQLRELRSRPVTRQIAVEFIFASLRQKHQTKWKGSRRQGALPLPKDLDEDAHPNLVLRTHQLFGVGGDAHSGLLGWCEDRYPLHLRTHIPSPLEMLEAQCAGQRIVTLLLDEEDQHRLIGRHKGALAFILHDLEHAHKFFGEPKLAIGQRRFFSLLRNSFQSWSQFDLVFQEELNYALADMNSHPVHMLKYLKAIWLNAFRRLGNQNGYDSFCEAEFHGWGLPLLPALRLNTPGQECQSDHEELLKFFLDPT